MMDFNTKKEIQKMIDDSLIAREQRNAFDVSLIPFHAHTGVDSPKIDSANIIETYAPFVADLSFTADEIYTISPGFTPQNILAYGYAFYNPGGFFMTTTTGSGDYISATQGICNSYRLGFTAAGALSSYGLSTQPAKLMYSGATVYATIQSWTATSVVLDVKCETGWLFNFAVSVTG